MLFVLVGIEAESYNGMKSGEAKQAALQRGTQGIREWTYIDFETDNYNLLG